MGVRGVEPRTSSLSGMRSNQLSYTPGSPLGRLSRDYTSKIAYFMSGRQYGLGGSLGSGHDAQAVCRPGASGRVRDSGGLGVAIIGDHESSSLMRRDNRKTTFRHGGRAEAVGPPGIPLITGSAWMAKTSSGREDQHRRCQVAGVVMRTRHRENTERPADRRRAGTDAATPQTIDRLQDRKDVCRLDAYLGPRLGGLSVRGHRDVRPLPGELAYRQAARQA